MTTMSMQERTLTGQRAAHYGDHVERFGPVPMLSAERIRELAIDSGLTRPSRGTQRAAARSS
jgi:hypothetical protein